MSSFFVLFKSVSVQNHDTEREELTHLWFPSPEICATYPQFVVKVKCIKQFDNVAVITFGQDVNLHNVVLQLVFTFCLDLFGCSQSSRVFVPGLKMQRDRQSSVRFSSSVEVETHSKQKSIKAQLFFFQLSYELQSFTSLERLISVTHTSTETMNSRAETGCGCDIRRP